MRYKSIEYRPAPDIKSMIDEIVLKLSFSHVDRDRLLCFRSSGSKSRFTVARIHALSRLWQAALDVRPCYVIEVIAERYDRLDPAEREKTMIHELLHIPKGFRGGFRHHKGFVTKRRVDTLHRLLVERRMYEYGKD